MLVCQLETQRRLESALEMHMQLSFRQVGNEVAHDLSVFVRYASALSCSHSGPKARPLVDGKNTRCPLFGRAAAADADSPLAQYPAPLPLEPRRLTQGAVQAVNQ